MIFGKMKTESVSAKVPGIQEIPGTFNVQGKKDFLEFMGEAASDKAGDVPAEEYGKYEKYIATELLAKYENSKAYREGSSTRKTAVRVDQLSDIEDELEDDDKRKEFSGAVEKLKSLGVVDFSYDKDDAQAIDRIWLIIEDKSVRDAYRIAGLRPKIDIINEFTEKIEGTIKNMLPDSIYAAFLKDQAEQIRERKNFTRYFTDDIRQNFGILRFILFLDSNEENKKEQMERVLSTRLFGDSKFFEREIRAKVILILHTIKHEYEEGLAAKGSQSIVTVDEGEQLLAEKGIVRYPEIFEFAGCISVIFDDGRSADFSTQTYGACINASMAERVTSVTFRDVERVLFIENKSVYVWYLSKQRKDNELVLYHGHFVSPAKGMWFKCIADEAERSGVRVGFWGDIDFSGFRKFVRLKRNSCPSLEPYEMGVKTLQVFSKFVVPLDNEKEKEHLKNVLTDDDYYSFRHVINYMLENKVRLEQENIPAE